jgi:predicted transcriptional regulator/uncharacterized protein YoxC
MGRKIPGPIKQEAMRMWLEGIFRDKIAEELKISQGAVSNIIKEFASDDREFILLREVALKIERQNIAVSSFASLVRLLEVLREKKLIAENDGHETLALMQGRLEALVVAFEVFCFRKNLQIEEFADLVTNMYNAAEILGIPLDKFPEYITDLKNRIEVLVKDVDRLTTKRQELLKKYKMTSESLQEYNADKPLVVKIQKLERALANAGEALKNEKFLHKVEKEIEQVGEELEWSVDESELIEANAQISGRHCYNLNGTETLNVNHLRELVMDVFNRPSKYPETIRDMMREYDMRREQQR